MNAFTLSQDWYRNAQNAHSDFPANKCHRVPAVALTVSLSLSTDVRRFLEVLCVSRSKVSNELRVVRDQG